MGHDCNDLFVCMSVSVVADVVVIFFCMSVLVGRLGIICYFVKEILDAQERWQSSELFR